jgi:hypothetical protein
MDTLVSIRTLARRAASFNGIAKHTDRTRKLISNLAVSHCNNANGQIGRSVAEPRRTPVEIGGFGARGA